MAFQTYDPQKVTVSVANITITGYATGSFVKVSRDEDAFVKTVGADGLVARTRNANRAGSIEVTLLQSSPSNDALSALALLDETSGTGVGAAQVKDVSGTSIASAQNAWVKKLPDMERGKELGEVTWVIDCDLLNVTVGGTLLV